MKTIEDIRADGVRGGRPLVLLCLLLALAGCVTKKVLLVNDQGEAQTCKATGRVGIVSGVILYERIRSCIGKAHARGFHEAPPGVPNAR